MFFEPILVNTFIVMLPSVPVAIRVACGFKLGFMALGRHLAQAAEPFVYALQCLTDKADNYRLPWSPIKSFTNSILSLFIKYNVC